jgi:hypothetical protein
VCVSKTTGEREGGRRESESESERERERKRRRERETQHTHQNLIWRSKCYKWGLSSLVSLFS